jgi:DNA-directed RNA polymerase subunit F
MSDLFAAGNVEEAKLTIQRAKDQVKEIYKDATDKDINQLMRSLEDYLQAFKNLAKKKHK